MGKLNGRKGTFSMIPNHHLDRTDLTLHEKAVLFQLYRYADNESRKCFPSLSTLACKTGQSRRNVTNAIKKLVEKKIIIKQKRTLPGTNGPCSNLYTIIDNESSAPDNESDAPELVNVIHQDSADEVQEKDLMKKTQLKKTITASAKQRKETTETVFPLTGKPMNLKRYQQLCAQYGTDVVDRYMQRVSDYCDSNGKSYEDHAAACANFMERDGIKPIPKQPDIEIPDFVLRSYEDAV